jgi:hypothetical protein
MALPLLLLSTLSCSSEKARLAAGLFTRGDWTVLELPPGHSTPGSFPRKRAHDCANGQALLRAPPQYQR